MSRKPRLLPTEFPADSQFAEAVDAIALPDSGWGHLVELGEAESRSARHARAEALELQALRAALHGDAASACWYLCRSLGVARHMRKPSEPSLDPLLELLGALSKLPAEVRDIVLPEMDGIDVCGISELCQQLAMARALEDDVWPETGLTPLH